MIYYSTTKSGSKSLTAVWCLGLACMFAWRGQWWLHLATLAIGSADTLAVSFLKHWMKVKAAELKKQA